MIIGKHFAFEAAHVLPKHPGKCSRLHGHSYHGTLELEGPIDGETGFVLDFSEVGTIISEEIMERFDHRTINEVFTALGYPGEATAENLALFISSRVSARLTGAVCLRAITLYETEKCFVRHETALSDLE